MVEFDETVHLERGQNLFEIHVTKVSTCTWLCTYSCSVVSVLPAISSNSSIMVQVFDNTYTASFFNVHSTNLYATFWWSRPLRVIQPVIKYWFVFNVFCLARSLLYSGVQKTLRPFNFILSLTIQLQLQCFGASSDLHWNKLCDILKTSTWLIGWTSQIKLDSSYFVTYSAYFILKSFISLLLYLWILKLVWTEK